MIGWLKWDDIFYHWIHCRLLNGLSLQRNIEKIFGVIWVVIFAVIGVYFDSLDLKITPWNVTYAVCPSLVLMFLDNKEPDNRKDCQPHIQTSNSRRLSRQLGKITTFCLMILASCTLLITKTEAALPTLHSCLVLLHMQILDCTALASCHPCCHPCHQVHIRDNNVMNLPWDTCSTPGPGSQGWELSLQDCRSR